MARRRRSSLAFSADQARAALGFLIDEGQLAAGEIQKALQRRDRLIRALRASLAALEQGVGKLGRQFKDSPFPMVSRKAGPDAQNLPAARPVHGRAETTLEGAEGRGQGDTGEIRSAGGDWGGEEDALDRRPERIPIHYRPLACGNGWIDQRAGDLTSVPRREAKNGDGRCAIRRRAS